MNAGAGPCRVVVCDDQSEIRTALAAVMVSMPNYQLVGEAADGRWCLQVLRDTGPDLLILDVAMPFGGPGLVREIREMEPGLAIVVFSAHRDDQIKAEMLAAGVDEYVVKTGRLLPLQQALNRVSGRE